MPLSFIFNLGNRKVEWVEDGSHVFGKKNSIVKKEVCCHDATASSFVAKVRTFSLSP
jgi:hypothetical protein